MRFEWTCFGDRQICGPGSGNCHRLWNIIPHPVASEHRWLVKTPRWIHSVLMSRDRRSWRWLPCGIVESPRRHGHVPFVNNASLCSRSIKRQKKKHKLDYYCVVFAHLATGCGINAEDPSGLDPGRESRTRGVARISLGLKASRDSHDTSQRDSLTWIQPLGVSRYKSRRQFSYAARCCMPKIVSYQIICLVYEKLILHGENWCLPQFAT